MFKSKIQLTILLLVIILQPLAYGQSVGQWGVAISGGHSQPIAGLKDWFKQALTYSLAMGQQYNQKWFIEALAEFCRFEEENLSGYLTGKLALSLEHAGVLVSGRYIILTGDRLKPFLNLGAGIYQWSGIRGAIQADSTVQPFVPFIAEKKLSEMNWGFRFGMGLALQLNPAFSVDIAGYYRFIVGDFYPTLQPNIELEGVSGFQTLNLALSARYYF